MVVLNYGYLLLRTSNDLILQIDGDGVFPLFYVADRQVLMQTEYSYTSQYEADM